jgi:hypothetical protein
MDEVEGLVEEVTDVGKSHTMQQTCPKTNGFSQVDMQLDFHCEKITWHAKKDRLYEMHREDVQMNGQGVEDGYCNNPNER